VITVWIQRIHTELFQHGVAVPEAANRSTLTRDRMLSDEVALSPAGRQRVRVSYKLLEASDVEARVVVCRRLQGEATDPDRGGRPVG
jgi:hypothetical protein